MDIDPARESLARAEALEQAGRRTGRWMVRWYVIFGVATLLFAVILAYAHTRVGMIVGILGWAAVIAGLSLFAARQKAAFRGLGKVHGIVIGCWGGGWAITVAAGSLVGAVGYLAGGLLCLAISLAGAAYVHRITR